MNTCNCREYLRDSRRVLVSLILVLMLSAFVAPIPISNAASTYDTAMTVSERIKVAKPNLGPFVAEETFEQDGIRMRLIVSGSAEENESCIFAEFQQTLIVLDDHNLEVSRQVTYHTTKMARMPETTTVPEEPMQPIALATDWGPFTTYFWHDVKFVSVPGSSKQIVKYDHPDNYYTYHPELWNVDWSLREGRYAIIHASQYVVTQTQSSATLWAGVLMMARALISIYGILSITVYALAYKILAATLVFLAVYAALVALWVELVWKTEKGDAWSYSYLGTNGWIQMSHGLWRNIWYYAYDTSRSL